MNTFCGNSSAINLNTAKQLDARELRWSQVLHCSLLSAYTEVTLEFAPSFNLPQRTLCSCRDPWRSQSCISCQLFLWVQGQPLLTLGLSVICHVLFSVWIHGYQASWEPSQALLGFCPLTSGTWQWSYHVSSWHILVIKPWWMCRLEAQVWVSTSFCQKLPPGFFEWQELFSRSDSVFRCLGLRLMDFSRHHKDPVSNRERKEGIADNKKH